MKDLKVYIILAAVVVSQMAIRAQEAVVREGTDSVSVSASDLTLQEVNVSGRRASTVKSRTSAFDTQRLNSSELCKAACCNLSESFETNASVDVAYSDAVTGAKQIRLLGLSGTYVQLLTENTPGIRGLAQQFGMEYIPGPWMESIQISKGTASVINGYESSTGQINIEYLKPKVQDPIAVNLMVNTEAHSEVNLTGGWQVTLPQEDSEKADVSTGILAHAQLMPISMDHNKDGFLDMPMGYNANLLNRWDIFKGRYTGRILVRGIYDERKAGQGAGNLFRHKADEVLYGIALSTKRIEGFMKNGYVIDPEREMSIGIITALSYHNQQNRYGKRQWNAAQTNAYLNAMFQMEPAEGHKITTGLSVNYDRYNEQLSVAGTEDLSRQELTPGIFAEYSYHALEQLTLVAGMRADYSTQWGVFFTPRVNVRYSPFEWWTLRVSAGMGYRSPNLIADNTAMLASSRQLFVVEGIKQERAVNTGIVTTFHIPISGRELQITGEYYYTHFLNCVFTDFDTDPHAVYIRNSYGTRNYSHTWQIEASMEVLRGWTMTAAFRETDVMQTIGDRLRQRPLTPRFKGLITTSYITPLRRWQFDATVQFNGGGRMPDPDKENPLWDATYKWYPQLMAQITKYWRTCSLYLGAENMTNFRQTNPVIAASEPFGTDFDASMVYGPVSGWKIYLGFRWNLAKKED